MDTAHDNFLNQKNALTRIQNQRTALYEAIEKVKAEQKIIVGIRVVAAEVTTMVMPTTVEVAIAT